ncbi:MAG: ABC transporter substrate-binding protein [Clostridia bacterium]|nr:ABC transporter substrate-binding protein [Clostridia bacterium]
MIRFGSIVLILIFSLSLCGCAPQGQDSAGETGHLVNDALGNRVMLSSDARVVSCYGSFADCWLLSGGSLVGVTDDAVEEGIVAAETVSIVGSVKSIDLERILALAPDYVILSADLAAHRKLEEALISAGVSYGYFRVDTFADYKALMGQFCAVNGREDLYQTHVLDVEVRIQNILNTIPKTSEKQFLLMRVFSTGMKAKGADNLAGQILLEFGLHNIADGNQSLLEDLSVEKVVLSDPEYIFALAMGEQAAADEFLRQNVENNPAWSGLTAVKDGKYYMLPKELFHYKPNERWDESYEYLAKILYPELFG